MSLFQLQNDSNVPTSKLTNGNAYWLNVVLAHTSGISDGTGDGQWSYNTGASHRIEYNATHKKWFDMTDGQPSKVSDTYNVTTTPISGSSTGANPAEVFLWNANGGQFLGKFANPFYIAPSGGGTGTNTGVGFTASFYDVTNNSFSYEVTHTSGFTSDQTYELHSTTLTPTFISDLVVGAASGSTNSRSHTWGTPDVIQVRDAYGTIGAELTLAHSSSSSSNGKVFCNFW